MLRNFYLEYLGYLTLGGGEFDNVTQTLVENSALYGTSGCKFEQNFRNSERGSNDRDRDAGGIYGKLVGDNVAGVKGPAKTVCRQIMLESHFQI